MQKEIESAYQTVLKKKDDLALALALSPFAQQTAELVNSGAYEIAAGSCYAIFRCLAKTCKEHGTVVEIHRHPTKDESFVLLRGKVRVNTYNDDGTVIDSVVLCPDEGLYGVDIPKGVWHNVECFESGSVFFECKEGPFVPHEEEGVLRLQR